MRRRWRLVLLVLLVVAGGLAGCQAQRAAEEPPRDPTRSPIRVASFDFPESVILAEIYAGALEGAGYPVERVLALGSRELVEPALEQGKVDLVPEYAGSALRFLGGTASADQAATVGRLRAAYARRGVAVLGPAPAQDSNAFAVTDAFASRHGVRTLSDLRRIAGDLVLGGPPECPERPLCLLGLRQVYGLNFKEFRPVESRDLTAAQLQGGELDVGMLQTTDGHLSSGAFVLLDDDRRMQPAENVTPVVRRPVLRTFGAPLAERIDLVSSRLNTASLTEMNRRVQLTQEPPATVAADWLDGERLAG
jgi:osmoprotectant transport system substrate-binding protein